MLNQLKDIKIVTVHLSQDDEIGRALWRIEETRKCLHELLENLDEAMLEWQPDETANSIGTLLYHIALIEMDWLYVEVLERPFPPHLEALFPWPARDENGRLSHITDETIQSHLAKLAAVRQALLEAFSTMSIKAFRRPRSFEQYDVSPEWVIFHLLEHEIEHRGHIQERLRQYRHQA